MRRGEEKSKEFPQDTTQQMSRRMQINPTARRTKLCTYARMRQSLFQGLCCMRRVCRSVCAARPPPTSDTQPTNAPPGYVTATAQRRNETDIAAERALSRPTCPMRPPPPSRTTLSSGNNVSRRSYSYTTSFVRSYANLRCRRPRGSCPIPLAARDASNGANIRKPLGSFYYAIRGAICGIFILRECCSNCFLMLCVCVFVCVCARARCKTERNRFPQVSESAGMRIFLKT